MTPFGPDFDFVMKAFPETRRKCRNALRALAKVATRDAHVRARSDLGAGSLATGELSEDELAKRIAANCAKLAANCAKLARPDEK